MKIQNLQKPAMTTQTHSPLPEEKLSSYNDFSSSRVKAMSLTDVRHLQMPKHVAFEGLISVN